MASGREAGREERRWNLDLENHKRARQTAEQPEKNVLEQITGHAEVRGLPPETAYWVCAYANNQFELGADLGILRAPLLIVLRVAQRAALLGGRN